MSDPDPRETAAQLFRRAYQRQMAGDFQDAINLYTQSIVAFPTAEAYTFRGWTYSFLGDLDMAIAECLEAINVDPEFGNPYNDIGAYLIEQGKLDEAIPWLKKALVASRYEAYFYPHFNLGRVYERKHYWQLAKECYAKAFSLNPEYVVALTAFRRLQAMFN